MAVGTLEWPILFTELSVVSNLNFLEQFLEKEGLDIFLKVRVSPRGAAHSKCGRGNLKNQNCYVFSVFKSYLGMILASLHEREEIDVLKLGKKLET